MRRFVTFLNTQLKISLRDMNMPIFALLMPLVIFLVLGILDEERLSRCPHRQRPPQKFLPSKTRKKDCCSL